MLTKAQAIASALRVATTDIAATVIVVSGDLAFAGKEEEYILGEKFLRDLENTLRDSFNGIPIYFVLVPGNHDCDFDLSDQIRNIAIDTFCKARRPTIELPTVDCCTRVQDRFFKTAALFHDADCIRFVNALYYEIHVRIENTLIVFNCYNTSWCSQLEECAGSMSFPVDLINPATMDAIPSLRVSVLHHPTNWMNPDNGHLVREHIESTSHVVLTGHEHLPERSKHLASSGAVHLTFEGGVLQEAGEDLASSFNVLLFDVVTDEYKSLSYSYRDNQYEIALSSGDWQPVDRGSLIPKQRFVLRAEFEEKLNNPGAAFTHPRKNKLTLRDLFVCPDLRSLSVSGQMERKPYNYIDGPVVIRTLREKAHVIVSGDQDCGKSSLAYTLFSEAYESGHVPIFLNGVDLQDISRDGFFKHLDDAFHAQYIAPASIRPASISVEELVILIDDFHRIRKNTPAKARLASWLTDEFRHLTLFTDDAFHIESLAATDDNQNPYFSYAHYSLPPLGFTRRDALIQRWYSLGDSDTTDPEVITAQSVRAGKMIDALLGKNLLPAHPIVVLTFLQTIESQAQAATAIGSYGQCYELLIRNALIQISDGIDDLTTLQNYLAELAYHFFVEKQRAIGDVDLSVFHEAYCVRYDVTIAFERYVANLRKTHVLRTEHGQTTFAYDYFYYYFVARYLSEHLTQIPVRNCVRDVADNLHSTENANVLLFLTHLSKDPLIVESVLARAEAFYKDVVPARLEDDVSFIAALITQIPQLVVADGDPELRRQEMLQTRDQWKHHEEFDEEETVESYEPLIGLNAALKTLDILGQILKNFPGAIEAAEKERIATASYMLGLRALNGILSIFRDDGESLVAALVHALRERDERARDEQLEKKVRGLIYALLELVAMVFIRRIASAVGSDWLLKTYRRISAAHPSPAVRLVEITAVLEMHKGIPEKEIAKLYDDVKDNLFARELLKKSLWHHFRIYRISERVVQRVCSVVSIDFPSTRSLPQRRR